MTAPLTLAQAHARWVQAKNDLKKLHVEISSVAHGYEDDYYKMALYHANNELREAEAALLALPSAPQEPPQAEWLCECGHAWRFHDKAGLCVMAGCRCVGWKAAAPQEPPQKDHFQERIAAELRADRAEQKVASAPQTVSTEPAPARLSAEALALVLEAARHHHEDNKWWRDVSGPAYFEANLNRAKNRRKLGEAIEALSTASAPQQGWQPIATAPKDGTRILVVGEGPRWQLGPVVARTLDSYDGWYSLPGKYYLDQPTLWSPLPAPPSAPTGETR